MNEEDALVEFLRARFDEDQARIEMAGEARVAWLTFRFSDGSINYTTVASSASGEWIAAGEVLPTEPSSVDVIFDPVRALADVKAKRWIIDHGDSYDGWDMWVSCIFALAQPYADHPDFDPQWLDDQVRS